MPKTKLEEIIESSDVAEFSQFFRLKTRAEGNFRPSDERLSQYGDADFFEFAKLGQIEFSESQRLLVTSAMIGGDLSERSGKKAQYEKAKKILRELSVYSAGIFVFYDKAGSFRFSLVYPESVGTRREWSNFRRFTYFVSKELTNKTFLQRVGDGDFSTLEKIKDAFSVEKVTKEFYLEYRKLFGSLMENLSKNHTFLNEASKNYINTENFAKKLLGQIVFLYFIQKKGWLGVSAGKKWGDGNKNFMGNIYKEAIAKKANFYNDYLEKLFYNALNNAHRDSADPSFSKDFGSRIPFLNGGLFEAEYDWKNSLMYLDNKIFQSIFDVFERYNFTVEEESPDDKEIAVDPEMLGKVFENLLPENLRKGKGTYYTPREIVYYMCRESLINYLVSNHSNITEENIRNYIFYSESFENFKKQKGESFTPGQWKELYDLLVNIKVCDPACGSGAFLVGMLNMIVKLRIFLQTTPDSHLIPQKKEYELKREAIQNCIYGVDIDPGAIEIAKLRLWLALVVDYDLEDIEPLPNLDYRLMCGNSLLEEFEGIRFYNDEEETQATLLVDPEKEKKIETLRKKVKEYFSIHDDKEKLKKRKEINDIKDWLVGTALEKRRQELTAKHKGEEAKANMLDEKSRKQYLSGFSKWLGSSSNIREALESLHNPKKEKPFFIWKLEFIDVFEEKGGFDVVIANPPYLEARSPEFSDRMKEDAQRGARNRWGADSEYITRGADLLIYFLELGIHLITKKGTTVFITQNSWLDTDYGKKFQNFLLSHTNVRAIIDSDFKYFDSRFGPNINTVISVFVGKEVDVKNTIVFARYHESFEKIDHSILYDEKEPPLSEIEIKKFKYKDHILRTLKWGTLLSASDEVLHIFSLLAKKGKNLSQLSNYNLSIGQGLNVAKSLIVEKDIVEKFPFVWKALIPFMRSEDGAPFVLEETKGFLIDGSGLEREETKKLRGAKIDIFKSDSTSKVRPILIMPRGVSRHYCAMNLIFAYSSSGVDIYDNKGNFSEEMRLNLWLFLNSSVAWLIREMTGRKSLGGGLLKAEATDLRELPIYFEFRRTNKIKEIYKRLKRRKALPTVEEIDTPEHNKIDELVFDHLEVPKKQRHSMVEILKRQILGRITKSRT